MLSLFPTAEAFSKELHKTLTQLCPNYKAEDTEELGSNVSSSNVSDAPEKQYLSAPHTARRPGDSKIETVLQRLHKPLFDVGAKSIALKSLASVQQYLAAPIKEPVAKSLKSEYRPPKRIGETDTSALQDSGFLGAEATAKITPVEEQLTNVLGYIQASWKNASFVKAQPLPQLQSADRTSIISESARSARGMSQNEDEELKEKQPELTGIAKDLAGLDVVAANPPRSVEESGRRRDSGQVAQKPAAQTKSEASPKRLTKEQTEAAAKEEKHKKLVGDIMGKMPDLSFLLSKSVVNAKAT